MRDKSIELGFDANRCFLAEEMTKNVHHRPLSGATAAAACCVSFNSTKTRTGSLQTPAVATIQQTFPHVHGTTAVGIKGQGRELPLQRELAAQDLTR